MFKCLSHVFSSWASSYPFLRICKFWHVSIIKRIGYRPTRVSCDKLKKKAQCLWCFLIWKYENAFPQFWRRGHDGQSTHEHSIHLGYTRRRRHHKNFDIFAMFSNIILLFWHPSAVPTCPMGNSHIPAPQTDRTYLTQLYLLPRPTALETGTSLCAHRWSPHISKECTSGVATNLILRNWINLEEA